MKTKLNCALGNCRLLMQYIELNRKIYGGLSGNELPDMIKFLD